jgi:ATP-dependent RNA helicase MSS116, mitochondrial
MAQSASIIEKALEKVPQQAKEQAYVAFLGFTKALKKIHGMDAPEVVKFANRYSESLGLEEPPALEPSTVGKMGLKGVPGLTIRRGASGKGGARAGPGAGGRPGVGGRKQPLVDDSTPPASSSENRRAKPLAGEPRHKRPKRETRGQGSAAVADPFFN